MEQLRLFSNSEEVGKLKRLKKYYDQKVLEALVTDNGKNLNHYLKIANSLKKVCASRSLN